MKAFRKLEMQVRPPAGVAAGCIVPARPRKFASSARPPAGVVAGCIVPARPRRFQERVLQWPRSDRRAAAGESGRSRLEALATVGLLSAGVLTIVAIGTWSRAKQPSRHVATQPLHTPAPSAEARRKTNEQTIQKYKNDPKPESQDKVGEAELHLAYLDAQKKDFASSRKLLLQAENVKGTGEMGADFGGINDQAAYQAAVCLVAEHKEAEARAAFRKFLVDYKLSPLAAAAEKRLLRLNHGKADPNDEALLQTAIRAQEDKGKFETTVCGPKTVAYLMKEFPKSFGGQPPKGYMDLAKLFGTGSSGTSLEELHDGLRKLGVESFAIELNRKDFQKLQLPAILLDGDHYFAILARHGLQVTVYDTLLSCKREITLPTIDDVDFRATVLAFSVDGLDEDRLTAGPPVAPVSPGAQTHSSASGAQAPSLQNRPPTKPSGETTRAQSRVITTFQLPNKHQPETNHA